MTTHTAAVAVAVAAVLGLLVEEDAIMSQDHMRMCSWPLLCVVQSVTVTSSLQIRCCWRPLAQRCLHGTVWPASCIRVAVQAPHDRRPLAVPCHDCLK